MRRHILPTDSFDQARIVFRTPGPKVAAFGDSRVNDGVMRTVDIANFAMPGDSLATVLGKLEAWLAKNPDGKVIVGVPPNSSPRRVSMQIRKSCSPTFCLTRIHGCIHCAQITVDI